MEKNISIFTPTYNRLETLKRAYKSLLEQTEKNFIWLVVDDGSNDGTKEWIEKVRNEKKIEIEYIYQNNGGKHRAHNNAVRNLKTDFMLILDSDDYLRKDCIEILNQKIEKIRNNLKVCGIIGARKNIEQEYDGNEIMPDVEYLNTIELYQKYKFQGETMLLIKKEILKRNLFPEIDGEKFVTESVILNKISCQYMFLTLKEKLYYYSYRNDGYTKNYNTIQKRNPIGNMLYLKSEAITSLYWSNRFKKTIAYIIWCKLNNIKNSYKNFDKKFLYIISIPIAYIMYFLKYPKSLY